MTRKPWEKLGISRAKWYRLGKPSARTYRSLALNRASPTVRLRRNKADIAAVKAAIRSLLKADNPMTVRQVFYRLVVKGLVEKTEADYENTVIRLLTDMRMDDSIPFRWIIDDSRPRSETRTYNSIADAARDTAEFYRRSALREAADYIEIWCEKQALAGIIESAADDFDVPVIVSRGMPSLTQLYGSACEIDRADSAGKQTYIYQFGDHDPSGVLIPQIIKRRLNELCHKLGCSPPIFQRVALTEEQIEEFDLPTRPTKRKGNPHANTFEGDSVELDALPSAELRRMVRGCIVRHISQRQLNVLRVAEDDERRLLEMWADQIEADQ